MSIKFSIGGVTGFDGEGWSRVASRGALASLTTEQNNRCQNTCLCGRFQLRGPSTGRVVETSPVTCGWPALPGLALAGQEWGVINASVRSADAPELTQDAGAGSRTVSSTVRSAGDNKQLTTLVVTFGRILRTRVRLPPPPL